MLDPQAFDPVLSELNLENGHELQTLATGNFSSKTWHAGTITANSDGSPDVAMEALIRS